MNARSRAPSVIACALALAAAAAASTARAGPFPTFRVTNNGYNNQFVRIDGPHVACTRLAPPGLNDVHAYNLATQAQLTAAATLAMEDEPAVSGDVVVWNQGGHLVGRRFSGGGTFTVASAEGGVNLSAADDD